MKKLYTLLFVLLAIQSFAQTPPGNWNLTWEDNFDGSHLDSKKWKMGLHWFGITDDHLFATSGKNVSVQNGQLTLIAEKRTETLAGLTKDYAAAEISTLELFKQKYGYFEARIKYDAVTGAWPAFWLMPNRGVEHTNANQETESYIKFDISALNSSITNAVFKIKITALGNNDKDSSLSVHKIIDNSSWTESQTTWLNRPAYDPAFLKEFFHKGANSGNGINQITVNQYIELDVTDYINNQITANKQYAGFALMDKFLKSNAVTFGSSENSDVNNRPVLVINGSNNIYPSDDVIVKILSSSPNQGLYDGTSLRTFGKWSNTSKIDDGAMEIDIMESLGIWGVNKNQHALHWDYYGANHPTATSGTLTLTPTNDGFHTYGVEWSEGEMKFYMDGTLTWTYTNPRVSNVDSYLILSHQLGGWDNNHIIDDANLPIDMIIDYVKVYEKGAASVETFNKNKASIQISPNPIIDNNLEFYISEFLSPENIDLSIVDILGKEIFYSQKINISENNRIRISVNEMHLNRGVYFLRVKGDNFLVSEKFIY